MAWNRRELLGALGTGSASTLLWALGCGGRSVVAPRAPAQRATEVRGWLRDAVARLVEVYPGAHALAVTRRRTTAAIDVLGTGVARARRDGVVLTVRDRRGGWREHVTGDLSEEGVRAAVRALRVTGPPAHVDFPAPPPPSEAPPPIDEAALSNRVRAIMRRDRNGSSRIVYAAALIDIDDVTLWSVAPDHDREHHSRRVLQRATRAAWNGTRPVVSEVERGWVGALDDQALSTREVTGASEDALHLMTPGVLPEGDATVVLDPGVTATILDAAVRGLLTSTAARRPEVARRLEQSANLAPPLIDLVDDPTVAAAYGGFAFDDTGAPAAPTSLVTRGSVTGRLEQPRRAGHVGELAPAPSHLRLTPGEASVKDLSTDGWRLEGKVRATFDPSSDQIVVGAARAYELQQGHTTGRVFADVELVGELGVLLGAVTGISTDVATHVIRSEAGGEPRWASISTPWVRTRGFVRARGRTT